MSLWMALLPPHAPRAVHRDATVAVVGFTSWAAVAGKILSSMPDAGASRIPEATFALGAALLCLWPLALTLACPTRYARWREFLIPMHLALQHWIGLHFASPVDAHARMGAPGWVRGLLPVFLASFCQPWLYLAFGACLQRTRLRTFLWTQPLLLAPLLWTGHSHCSRQLAATPEAAGHVARIAAAMRRASTWLPVGLLPGGRLRSGGDSSMAAAAAAAAAAEQPQAACLAVHLWLVLVLSFCLPAIVIHRLEGQELQAEEERKQRQQRRHGGDNGSGGSRWGGRGAAPRQLLLQQAPSLPLTAAELLLAGFTAWQVVQVLLLLKG